MSNKSDLDVKVKRIDYYNKTYTVQASCVLGKTAQGLLLLAAPEIRNVKTRVTVDRDGGMSAYVHIRLRQEKNRSRLGGNFGDITRQVSMGSVKQAVSAEGVTAKLLKRASNGKTAPGDALVIKALTLVNVDEALAACIKAAVADYKAAKKQMAPAIAAQQAVVNMRSTATNLEDTGRRVSQLIAQLDATLTLGGDKLAVMVNINKMCADLRESMFALDQQRTAVVEALAALKE